MLLRPDLHTDLAMKKRLLAWLNSPSGLRRILNLYGPYLGAGVRVRYLAKDYREAQVEMKLRWYNRNYVGTHFGGSLFAMIDPFYMLLLMNSLGRDYIVWDASADIDFHQARSRHGESTFCGHRCHAGGYSAPYG